MALFQNSLTKLKLEKNTILDFTKQEMILRQWYQLDNCKQSALQSRQNLKTQLLQPEYSNISVKALKAINIQGQTLYKLT